MSVAWDYTSFIAQNGNVLSTANKLQRVKCLNRVNISALSGKTYTIDTGASFLTRMTDSHPGHEPIHT